jgi:hypothetical protein
MTGRPQRVSEFAPLPKPKPQAKLPDKQEGDFASMMREHYAIAAERDMLRHEVSDLKTKLSATEAAMTMLEANINAAESRVISYQAERDQAVADRVKWEALFASIYAQLRAFKPPERPLVAQTEE